jgi:hypothetical protein
MRRPLRLLLGAATWLGLAAAAWLGSRRRSSTRRALIPPERSLNSEPGQPAATKRARSTTRRRGGATRAASKGAVARKASVARRSRARA